jgi:hypothetical protein
MAMLWRPEIEMGLHRFGRIHVDVFHEPARLIGTDGEECEIDRPNRAAISRKWGP